MNDYIKAMCLKLAELALETKDVYVDTTNHHISISHYTASNRHDFSYHDNISFKHDTDAEERIEKALDYVRSLGGSKNV